MRRPRYPSQPAALPPPLPPGTRTVGQLVAESLRLYGERFWPVLALGAGPAAIGVMRAELPRVAREVLLPTVGSLIAAVSYVAAVAVARRIRPRRRALAVALAAGTLAFAPVLVQRTFLFSGLDLATGALFAAIGLAVPVALVEDRGLASSLARAWRLARADFVHAFGSLLTLVLTVLLSGLVLFLLLQSFGDAAARVAAFVTLLVLSPVILLGLALLYDDQVARVGSPRRRKGAPHADLHPALDPDAPGPPDAERQP